MRRRFGRPWRKSPFLKLEFSCLRNFEESMHLLPAAEISFLAAAIHGNGFLHTRQTSLFCKEQPRKIKKPYAEST